MAAFNEEFRYGSAHWASGKSIRRARLLKNHNRHIGYYNGRALNAHGDASSR